VAGSVLNHRLVVRAESELEGLTADDVVRLVLDSVPVPR
jgi:MoxR-like ATPase